MLQNSPMYLLREAETGITPRDFALAYMEKQGVDVAAVTRMLQKQMKEQNINHLPFEGLPASFQEALYYMQDSVMQHYSSQLPGLHRQIFQWNARINRRASHPLYSPDKSQFASI